MIKLLSMMLLFAASAGAQSGTTSQPCTIGEYKGTCFYVDGKVSYWLVRKWQGVAGPTSFDETIGYPSVLKTQQDYNRWIKTQKEIPLRLYIDAPKLSHDERRFGEDLETIQKQTQEGMAGRYTPGLWNKEPSAVPPVRHGWGEKGSGWQGTPALTIPNELTEIGGLDRDTLRVPLYKTGATLVAAFASVGNDCDCLTEIVFWDGGKWSASGWNSEYRKMGACNIDTPPDDRTFADMQALLMARKKILAAALGSSLKFDKIFDPLNKMEYMMGSSSGIAIERLPSGLLEQITVMTAEIEELLRQAVELESEYQAMATAYKAKKKRESDERMRKLIQRDKELSDQYAEEYFKRFGVRLHPFGSN